MKKYNNAFAMLLIFAISVCSSILRADDNTDQVIVVGMDALGNAKAGYLPKAVFKNNMSSAITTVSDSMISSLQLGEQAPLLTPLKLELRTIGVGMQLSGQFGLGPLFNITLTPRLRLIYTNSLNPVYPD